MLQHVAQRHINVCLVAVLSFALWGYGSTGCCLYCCRTAAGSFSETVLGCGGYSLPLPRKPTVFVENPLEVNPATVPGVPGACLLWSGCVLRRVPCCAVCKRMPPDAAAPRAL